MPRCSSKPSAWSQDIVSILLYEFLDVVRLLGIFFNEKLVAVVLYCLGFFIRGQYQLAYIVMTVKRGRGEATFFMAK